MNTDLLIRIQTQLEAPRENLSSLLCETLMWGPAQTAAFRRDVTVAPGETVSLAFTPVAQVSGLPILRVDWPFTKLPGVTQRRSVYHILGKTYVEHLLAYITKDDKQAAFVWARRRGARSGEEMGGGKIEMRTLPYTSGSPARTTVEQLGKLAFSMEELGLFGDPGRSVVTDKLDAAFDVEKVTKAFFSAYRRIFEEAEQSITMDWNTEQKRLYTQRFFNRLMFLTFVERKGWLVFSGRRDYLRALFADYQRSEEYKRREANFHRTRLNTLFFLALNNRYESDKLDDPQFKIFRSLAGEVPYLNGGLFEKEDDDETWFFPDAIVAKILTDLVYAFNFTVTESTPLDVEVAVDPEMLGMIFEELVTGRHETGSYYTPKPVVAFMCRESLKRYLETTLSHETPEAIARFVDISEGGALRDPETALGALRRIKVCDPACGSGAYLLGMLHELLEQRASLFVVRQLDSKTIYERKLEIIQNSLYGVDIDPFAVSIARLRLWLSLIVDFEGGTPPPLPNLNYKIETGDSLTAPDPSGGLQPDLFRYGQVQEYLQLKNDYMTMHQGAQKKYILDEKIKKLRKEIADWAHPIGGEGFDWAVEFAEVFMPELADATINSEIMGKVNTAGGQIELTSSPREGGFDIILANPPYVNMVEMDASDSDYRDRLRSLYISASGGFDIFVPFMERRIQLLKKEGVLAYITPNKLLSADYARTLREYCFENTELVSLSDLSSIPIFSASVYPIITIAAKNSKKEKRAVEIFQPKGQLNELVFERAQSSPAEIISLTEDYLWSPLLSSFISKLSPALKNCQRLDSIAEISGAATVSEAYEIKEAIINNGYSLIKKFPQRYFPFIVSGNIRQFFTTWQTENVQYIKTTYQNPAIDINHNSLSTRRKQQIKSPKIILSGMSKHPTCFWDEGIYASGKSTVVIFPKSNEYGAFLCGILNSEIMNSIYHTFFGSLSLAGGYLRFGPPQISALPIPNAESKIVRTIAESVQQLQKLHRNSPSQENEKAITQLQTKINSLVALAYGLD